MTCLFKYLQVDQGLYEQQIMLSWKWPVCRHSYSHVASACSSSNHNDGWGLLLS